MPLQRCEVNGKPGWKWGKSGKCYTGKNGRSKARRQERAIRASGWTENANGERVAVSDRPPSKISPLKADPSRTFLLRRMFTGDFKRRFKRLQRAIYQLVVTEDAFGIDPRRDPLTNERREDGRTDNRTPTTNTQRVEGYSDGSLRVIGGESRDVFHEEKIVTNNQRWKFRTNAEQLRLFEDWLKTQIQEEILQSQIDAYWERYIEESYKKGMGRSFDEVNKGLSVAAGSQSKLDFYRGSKSQFLADSFNQPASIEKVKLLAGRVYTDLNGVTDAMASQIKRLLVDGMIQGKNPLEIAREMNKTVEGVGINRASAIARTEIMRAHAEGQLDAFDKLGVTQLGVMVEWSVAGDGGVCPLCAPLDKIVISLKEARGMLPRHPNCRCVWLPSGVGESGKGQKKSKVEIDKAIDTSVRREIPKKSKRGLKEQSKVSPWSGARKRIDKERPKSILDQIREKKEGKKSGTKKLTKPKPKRN